MSAADEYWENRYKKEGALWQFEPSDSALVALKLFQDHLPGHLLIPGVGYGRNAKLFHEAGFELTGIEISGAAIDLARKNGLHFRIHHGSVTDMPFDNVQYEGIFCYALAHLLNRNERKKFIRSCFQQLKSGGLMVFVVASREMSIYGTGKYLSRDRYRIPSGLNVFFYDGISILREFSGAGLVHCSDIAEPVKFMPDCEPIPLKFVLCRKN